MSAPAIADAPARLMPAGEPAGRVPRLSLLVAVLAIGAALQRSSGHVDGPALLLLTGALLAAIVGLGGYVPVQWDRRLTDRALERLAGAGVLWQLWSMLQKPVGRYLAHWTFGDWSVYAVGVLAAALLAIAALAGCPRRIWLPALAIIHFALGMYTIHLSPEPHIDVFYAHREAGDALLAGRNPYAASWPDIYGNDRNIPGSVAQGRVVSGLSYPPVSFLCAFAGHLLGDFRYAALVAMSAAALLIGFSSAAREAGLIAALFLFTPRTFFVLEQGWTEPFVLVMLAAAGFCFSRGKRTTGAVFLGLFLASKQHLFPLAALCWMLPRLDRGAPFRWKDYGKLLGTAALAGGLVTLPFLLWNPPVFLRAMTATAVRHTFRSDSLSYMAWLFQRGITIKLTACGYLAGLAAMLAGMWKAPRTRAGFAATAGLAYLMFFLLSDYAFCNYYYMTVGMFAMAAAWWTPQRKGQSA
jgi:hypothetical protein